MKGQRYVPTDFGSSPTTAATGETRIIRAEPVHNEAATVVETPEPAPTYVQRAPARRNNALWVAGPLALAALVGGALWAANSGDDDAETTEVAAAETVTPTAAAAPGDELEVDVAEAPSAAPAPAAAPARVQTAASAPAPVARVQRTTTTRTTVARATPRATPTPAAAASASDTGVDVSGAVDLSSPAAGSAELPAGPQPYAATGPALAPAPIGEVEPTSPTPPVVTEEPAVTP